jgi:cation transport regulator ChaC
VGHAGATPDYIQATVAHMRETGIIDAQLFALAARLDPENAGIR